MGYDWHIWFEHAERDDLYLEQLREAYIDIGSLGKTYLDVGCGRGRFLKLLESDGKKVVGLDKEYNDIDLITGEWPDKKFDVVFANLTLLHIPEQHYNDIVRKMKERATKFIYVFDEVRDMDCGSEVTAGFKYAHDPVKHFGKKFVFKKQSEINPLWWRYLYKK